MKLTGYTEELSVGSAIIASTAHIPPQASLAIRIDMADNGKFTTVVATAKCVHQTFSAKLGGFRYWLQFLKMSDEARGAIEAYVARRQPAPY